MKNITILLSALFCMLFTTGSAQTQNIRISADPGLCSSVDVLLYAIDVTSCAPLIESDWLTFTPGMVKTVSINAAIWPRGFTPTRNTRVEAVLVQSCRNASPIPPIACTNIGYVKVGNAASACPGFAPLLANDCFEDPGTCTTCSAGTVFNVTYNHITATDLEVYIY